MMVGTPISSASLNRTPGGDPVAVVDQHPHTGGLEPRTEFLGRGALRTARFASDHEVHVGWGDLPRPAEAVVVAGCLGDRGDGS